VEALLAVDVRQLAKLFDAPVHDRRTWLQLTRNAQGRPVQLDSKRPARPSLREVS
jgi:hypothetical protein